MPDTAVTLSPEQVLRSVNIVFDADSPQRIAHFMPTAKTARLVGQLLAPQTSDSYFVVAPYGSGKSLTGAFVLQTVENAEKNQPILQSIATT